MLDRDATGFKDKRNVEFNGQLALNYEIFKGLKARAFFAYDYTNLAQKEMKTACTFYTYDSVQDTYNPITKVAKGELMEKTQPYYKLWLYGSGKRRIRTGSWLDVIIRQHRLYLS